MVNKKKKKIGKQNTFASDMKRFKILEARVEDHLKQPQAEWEKQLIKIIDCPYLGECSSCQLKVEKIKELLELREKEVVERIREWCKRYHCDFNYDYEKMKPKHKTYIALDDLINFLNIDWEYKLKEKGEK